MRYKSNLFKILEISIHNNLFCRCYVESTFRLDLYNSWIKELGRTKYNFKVS